MFLSVKDFMDMIVLKKTFAALAILIFFLFFAGGAAGDSTDVEVEVLAWGLGSLRNTKIQEEFSDYTNFTAGEFVIHETTLRVPAGGHGKFGLLYKVHAGGRHALLSFEQVAQTPKRKYVGTVKHAPGDRTYFFYFGLTPEDPPGVYTLSIQRGRRVLAQKTFVVFSKNNNTPAP